MQHRLRQARRCIEDMLAIVEDQQQPLFGDAPAQRLDQGLVARLLYTERLRRDIGNQCGIVEWRKVDEENTVAIGILHFGRELQREPGLADSARTDECQQSILAQQSLEIDQLALAAHERSQRLGEMRDSIALRCLRHPALQRTDRTYKAIATPRERLDPPLTTRHLREHASIDEIWTLRLPSSTTRPGQAASMMAFFVTGSLAFCTRTASTATARGPSDSTMPTRVTTPPCGSRRNGPIS